MDEKKWAAEHSQELHPKTNFLVKAKEYMAEFVCNSVTTFFL